MKNEKGIASIEATLTLTLFVFVIMAIYMLINFSLVQSRVSYAINTSAKEMSQYSYFYHVFSLENVDKNLSEGKMKAVDTFSSFNKLVGDAESEINAINENPNDYFGNVLKGNKINDWNEVYKQIQEVSKNITEVINDPVEFMKSMAAMAGEKIWERVKTNVIAAPLSKGLSRRHFGNSATEANEYLSGLGVINGFDGINFNMSTLFEDGTQDVNVVVYYTLDLASGFPFDLKINICQQASTRAWLGGDLVGGKEK